MAIKYNDLYMDLRRRLREAGAEDATQAALIEAVKANLRQ